MRTDEEWRRYRFDSIKVKEQNTYTMMDSLMDETGINKYLENAGNLAIGRIPIKFIDLDLTPVSYTHLDVVKFVKLELSL